MHSSGEPSRAQRSPPFPPFTPPSPPFLHPPLSLSRLFFLLPPPLPPVPVSPSFPHLHFPPSLPSLSFPMKSKPWSSSSSKSRMKDTPLTSYGRARQSPCPEHPWHSTPDPPNPPVFSLPFMLPLLDASFSEVTGIRQKLKALWSPFPYFSSLFVVESLRKWTLPALSLAL